MATFGKLTNGAGSSSSSTGRKRVSAATPSTSGTLTKLTGRFWLNAAGSTNVRGVVYSSTAGSPDALLATGDEVTITHEAEQEVDLPFSGGQQLALVGGTEYFIGWIHDDPGTPSVSHSRDSTASLGPTNTDTYSDGPSDPFGTVDAQTGPIDCYGTYTEASGSDVKSVGDLAIASVKTKNGLAVASVKTFNGLA